MSELSSNLSVADQPDAEAQSGTAALSAASGALPTPSQSVRPLAAATWVRSLPYGSTILLSAFLVFQVQPWISKAILPWFGGSPAVWTTCMLFFQVLLFAGYLYAHFLTQYVSFRLQAVVQAGLLLTCCGLLPVAPEVAWKPQPGDAPLLQILGLLATSVGLPYFVLASTGPLLQSWFHRTEPDRSPYGLYAISNIGSLVALLSYPVLVEPLLPVSDQGLYWSISFGLFALFCSGCAWRVARLATIERTCSVANARQVHLANANRPALYRQVLWLLLAALASVMLLAITNHLCQDVAVIPFLWIAPLSLYLVSFIVCFESDRWYRRAWCAPGLLALLVLVAAQLYRPGSTHLAFDIALNLAALFLICLVCHGELALSRPSPQHLTRFYLWIAAGGAAGGLLVSIVAPLVFVTPAEFKGGLIASFLVGVASLVRDPTCWNWLTRRRLRIWPAASVALIGLVVLMRAPESFSLGKIVYASRNFYGALAVDEVQGPGQVHPVRALRHGRIMHGLQFLEPERRHQATTYYAPNSGIGLVLQHHPLAGNLRVGVVGLGNGTVAAYAAPGDYYRFYEINPTVIDVAHRYFTYLPDCRARYDLVLGDARLSLEREPAQQFHVLLLDAFSGDAVPMHLLTQEAFAVYQKHLHADGVLVMHITNRHVELRGVAQALADRFGYQSVAIETTADDARGTSASLQVLLTRQPALLQLPAIQQAAKPVIPPQSNIARPLWRDDYSNLLEVLRSS